MASYKGGNGKKTRNFFQEGEKKVLLQSRLEGGGEATEPERGCLLKLNRGGGGDKILLAGRKRRGEGVNQGSDQVTLEGGKRSRGS